MTGRLKPLLYKRSLPPQTKKLGDGSAISSVEDGDETSTHCHNCGKILISWIAE